MNRAARLYCLHGFLGLPADWGAVLPAGADFRAVDLLALGAGSTGNARRSLAEMADDLNALARAEGARPRVLVGYSMGGRLALHSLARDAGGWDAAVIIAANPGLATEVERQARAAADAVEASAFARDPWREVSEKWLAKSVFAGRRPPSPREESSFDRMALAWAMREWSLGKQTDQRAALRALATPVLFLAGSEDPKYATLARECASLNLRFESGVLDGAAHRVPWEAPTAFRASLARFLGNHALQLERI